ncbi:MAG: helix-turn-helix domain-containing protein [Kofleriaceae bacterium]|nr:MAG: helix-turn-helix domain-containing protein [Kofleriaceae bacterium]
MSLEASTEDANAAVVITADAATRGDARGPAIVRAVATGFCVGAKVLLAELGDDRARALLASPAGPQNDPVTPPVPAEVMSADETAAFLGVDRNTVYDAAGRGEIPHRRIGKRLLFSRAQLVSWLGACKAAPVRNG